MINLMGFLHHMLLFLVVQCTIRPNKSSMLYHTVLQKFRNVLTVFWLCMGCRRPFEGVDEKFGSLEMLNLYSPTRQQGEKKSPRKPPNRQEGKVFVLSASLKQADMHATSGSYHPN